MRSVISGCRRFTRDLGSRFPQCRFWTARRGAVGYRDRFRLADPFLDFLRILNRNGVLHLKPFAQGKSVPCSAVEVALRARVSS